MTKAALITPTAYSRHRGCDEKAVRKAVAAGRISTINGMIDPVVADIQWAANTRARADSARPPAARPVEALGVNGSPAAALGASAAQPGPADPTQPADEPTGYSVDRARREKYEADLAQMKLLELQGDLVRAVEVRAEMAKAIGQLRQNALQMPARLAPLITGEPDQAKVHAMLDAEVRTLLTAVATPAGAQA